MAFLSYLQPIRDLFFKERDFTKAEEALQPYMTTAKSPPRSPEEERGVYELMGLILRAQGRYREARALYELIRDFYQAGYCAMLEGDLPQVHAYWTQTLQERQNHWCVSLYGMVTQQLRTLPTLFQIRNHLESDIANLIAAKQFSYLDNLLQHVEFMTQLNLEAAKFAGRALMHNGLLDRAGPFLAQGQRALPNDPEIYFHLGQFGMAQNHPKEASLMLKQCLMISPTYTPARELLQKIPEAS